MNFSVTCDDFLKLSFPYISISYSIMQVGNKRSHFYFTNYFALSQMGKAKNLKICYDYRPHSQLKAYKNATYFVKKEYNCIFHTSNSNLIACLVTQSTVIFHLWHFTCHFPPQSVVSFCHSHQKSDLDF